MATKNVHSGHRKRLRDRAMQEGLTNFDPHQIVEMLLFYVIPRQDTSEIAHNLIDEFGSVYGVLNAPQEELMKIPGVGKKAAAWFEDLGHLVTNYGQMRAEDRPKIVNCRSATQFANDMRFRCIPPSTYQICTAPSGTIQSFSKISDSTLWGESDVLKVSLRESLSVKARSVIIIEYQESAKPVYEEYHLGCAEKYARTLSTMDIELLDVILVGREDTMSLSREGIYDKKKYGHNLSVLADNYMREEIDIPDYGEDLPELDHGL